MKIGLVSLGCPKNLVDSEVMLGLAQQAGHTLTSDAAEADVLVVNTCAFIESAREESVAAILEMAAHKTGGRCTRLVVTGCMAERYRDELRAEIPEIDVVLGTGEVPAIVEAVEGRAEALPRQVDGQAAASPTVPLPLYSRQREALALRSTAPPPEITGRSKASAAPLPEITGRSKASAAPLPEITGRSKASAAPLPEITGRSKASAAPLPEITGRSKASAAPLPEITGRSKASAAPLPEITGRSKASAAPLPEITGRSKASALLPTYLYSDLTPRTLTTPSHLAYVKIAEGCNYKCSFCIIPRLRGAYRSRPVQSIVREAEDLAARGVKELILISQDSTFYGYDRGERGALARLLRQLDEVEGLAWIRVLYLYPTTVTTETLNAMAECDKVCKYVDLPLQHASDPVLKRMRRPGTRASYVRLIQKIRATVPGVTLRSTFIVGFPGETDAEFAELREFVHDMGFDHVGVFTYSHEEGTSAGRMKDNVPRRVKLGRQRQLMTAQKRLVAAANRRRVGQRVRVLVDGPSAEHPLVVAGRLASQAPEIDPIVYLSEADPAVCRPGVLVDGEVVAARGYDLVVRPLPPAVDSSGL